MKHKIVAVRKFHDGSVQSIKLDDGNVLTIERAIDAAKAGLIDNVRVEINDAGREYLQPTSSAGRYKYLEDFPTF
ncbi:DUF3892 domain-containing protein [Thermotalea metallivorans]|uniref:DUF3892 domain-containing protein n=1 Tax=Thermotalea metallivorans TaxID=520762 RepID=A0A140L1I9_9FIRM|nr:DUF3892 domain-containing protein [Thermotalea metallivorans]KXG74414.1 hypothetical protein AN619_23970 [Thermotalea metallivorans]